MFHHLNFGLTLLFTGLMFQSVCQPKIPEKHSGTTEMRAPAYPLITIDPYTCAWSTTDQLFDGTVSHWTGKTHGLIGAIRVDGQVYRFLGKESVPWKILAPMATYEAWKGKFTSKAPSEGWNRLDFDDASWEAGKGAFGTKGAQALSTIWKTKDIWVRREFEIREDLTTDETFLVYSHDDNVEIYLNGKELVNSGFTTGNNTLLKIDNNLLVRGKKNVLAAHCQNPMGGGLVDFGLFQKREAFQQEAIQNNLSLSATQTHYDFTCGPVNLKLQFVSPLLPQDLDLMSRPVNYINYEVVSNDAKKHDVQIYFEITPEWAVNEIKQEVVVTKGESKGIKFVKAGTTEQPILQKKGDNVRIDWGYVYLAANKAGKSKVGISDFFETKQAFIRNGQLLKGPDELKTIMTSHMPAMAYVDELGVVSGKTTSKGYLMLAYDDLESIQYFGDNLKAWWTNEGKITINDVLQRAADEHNKIIKRCDEFDKQLWDETLKAGGKNYADLCVLAFRQSIAAHKLVKDTRGNLLFLSKENFSNGSIGTVDVTYPSAPLFLKYNPDLLKGMLTPIFYFSESGKWTKPFPSHDVGSYPLANGQTYGGDMPVEEGGNMLILTTAIAQMEGNADYAKKHWDVLTVWANYLLEHGLDPDNQLCTDDFAGHLAHNVNLSVKAITAIAGYGRLAEMLGKKEIAEKYTSEAKRMGKEWMQMADDGDHYRLSFDQPGTWSQKYNLVWDQVLKLGIFPKEVAQKEVAYYLTKQNKYGLPLDNRKDYTKTDWIVWSATMAGDLKSFQKLIDPLHLYITETPNRVPMSDWYGTYDAVKLNFQARSVVGAYFIKLLK
jgi:hypothetical protein